MIASAASHGHDRVHAHGAGPEAERLARIGPNAIIQTAAVLVDRCGAREAEALLAEATPWALDRLPEAMVDEREVTALVRAVVARYSAEESEAILRESGVRTADYLLRVRIPRVAQRVLGALPRGLALRLLLSAIAKHSWTFAGSAQFAVERTTRGRTTFVLRGCPICRGRASESPACHYYASTVERLLRVIISDDACVREVACEAMGALECRFAIDLTGRGATGR